jgi:hypothetical protein
MSLQVHALPCPSCQPRGSVGLLLAFLILRGAFANLLLACQELERNLL